ncbi:MULTISPECIES: GumC family protein [unclassified Anabaena]|uniref:GumC family protein n=1 Tax=unclassified Anabaena TaxID=2619674 RepID=UPI0039C6F831
MSNSEKFVESKESIDLDLSHYLLTVKRRWILVLLILAGTFGLSVVATTLMKPSYEAEGKLFFRMPSFKTVGNNLLPSQAEGQEAGDLRSLISTQNPISTQMQVISSPSFLQQVIDKLQLKNDKGEPLEAKELERSLDLKIVGGTDVLQINYSSRQPDETAAVINTIMDLYLQNDILINRSEAEATRDFMSQQLPQSRAALNKAEEELRIFRQKYNIADLPEETRTSVGLISNLNNEINTVQAQLAEVNAQTNELRQKVALNSQEAIVVSTLSQSPAVQGVLTQLQETELQLANERSRFQDENPVVVGLVARRASLQNLLQQQIAQTVGNQANVPPRLLQIGELRQNLIQNLLQSEVQRSGLSQRVASLYNSRSTYEQRLRNIPQLVQTQRDLERKVTVAETTYQNLLQKVQQLEVAENRTTPNARIIAQALVPTEPASGKKLIVLALGLMSGIFLSTTAVLFLELRDKSLKTTKEVREVFNYTPLGMLPLLPSKANSRHREPESITPEIAVRDMPYSLTSEMYRMIQANLKFLSSDKDVKTIVVASAVPKEGKSTVSANLAAAIAQLGRKVLLIDADMRMPSQHHLWELTNAAGLSEVLVGQAEFRTAVNTVMDHLDVLTAGVRPPNPLALLESKHMASLIQQFASQYDCVIIDAPPLLLAADALTLNRMSDGMLLVSRPEVIDYNSAVAAQEMLDRANHNVLGLVVNGIIEKNESSSYFYHAKEYFPHEKLSKKDVALQKR